MSSAGFDPTIGKGGGEWLAEEGEFNKGLLLLLAGDGNGGNGGAAGAKVGKMLVETRAKYFLRRCTLTHTACLDGS